LTKINQHFAGLVVRKDLVKTSRATPSFPPMCWNTCWASIAPPRRATIQSGIETVREILRKHYVHRNEAGLVRSNIKEKGRTRSSTASVSLNDKSDAYEARVCQSGHQEGC
jgi:ATP-dependent Lon protease